MTIYTKTMKEALESMYISEDNVAILRDIVKRKSIMTLKFADGKMKVDLFTASAVTQALDKVNPANKAKITKMINTGKKANFMSIAKVVMKSENDPEIEEEVELDEAQKLFMFKTKAEAEKKAKEVKGKVLELKKSFDNNLFAVLHKDLIEEEVEIEEGKYLKYSDLLLKKARLIDKKGPDSSEVKEVNKEIKAEMKRLGIKEEVELDENKLLDALKKKLSDEGGAAGFKDLEDTAKKMDVDLTPDMLKKMSGIKQHRDGDYILEEAELDEAVNKDWQKAVHDLSKKMGASVASGAKGKIIPFVSMNGDTTDVGYTDSKGKKHTIYTTKKSLPRAEKDKMIADIRKKFSEEFSEEAELDEAMLIGRDYEYDEKEGVVKISKKNFAKVKKDYKGTDKSKPTMMVLTKKGTSLVPVKFTEEVELDEALKTTHVIVDTAQGNKVISSAAGGNAEKNLQSSIASAERPPLSIKDKKTLKIVKLKKPVSQKKADDLMGQPLKEEVEESYEYGTDEYAKHTRDVTPGQGKEIDEARPNARRDAMKAMGKRKSDSADDDDYVATDDDRKAADKNIIMQLRKATNLGGKYEVEFKDKKKIKVKPAIAMAFIKKYEKMKPVDKAKLQDKGSKSYKDLLKGLKEEDTSMLGRIERKLKEIRNG